MSIDMKENRLKWEPESLVSICELERRAKSMGIKNASILPNGTILFITSEKESGILDSDMVRSLNSIRHFSVFEVDIGGYIVQFLDQVCVYVSETEFTYRRAEVMDRQTELMFPNEPRIQLPETMSDELAFVGLYGRGKLQRDIHYFDGVFRI